MRSLLQNSLAVLVLAFLSILLVTGCSRHKYSMPARADVEDLAGNEPAAGDPELAEQGKRYPDYFVLAYSPLNVAGRREPNCPFEVLETVQARTAALSDSETWQQDKAYASKRPSVTADPLGEDGRAHDPEYVAEDLAFPKRIESKLLALLRQTAQRLGADAVVDITIHTAGTGGRIGLAVMNKEIGGQDEIEKITGKAVRFTDPDCRR